MRTLEVFAAIGKLEYFGSKLGFVVIVEREYVYDLAFIEKRVGIEAKKQVFGAGFGFERTDIIVQCAVPFLRGNDVIEQAIGCDEIATVNEWVQFKGLLAFLDGAVIPIGAVVDEQLPRKYAKKTIGWGLNRDTLESFERI